MSAINKLLVTLVLLLASGILQADDTYTPGIVNYTSPYQSSGSVSRNDSDIHDITATLEGTIVITVTTTGGSGTASFVYSASGTPTSYDNGLVTDTMTFSILPNNHIHLNVYNVSTNAGHYVDYVLTVQLIPPGNIAPVSTDNNYTISPTTSSVSGNVITDGIPDYDINGDPISIKSFTNPGTGTWTGLSADGFFDYNATAVFPGFTTFTYTVEDNSSFESNTSTVGISWPIPVANDDVYICEIDGSITGYVITDFPADKEYDHNLTITTPTVVTTPKSISITFSDLQTGEFSYTPPLGYNGSDSFEYCIQNAFGNTDCATATIYVNNNCAYADLLLDTNDTSPTHSLNDENLGVTGTLADNEMQYYKIFIDTTGVLEINISNGDTSDTLRYDFAGENIPTSTGVAPTECPTLFTKGTTSQLDAGNNFIDVVVGVVPGQYYLGIQGGNKNTFYEINAKFWSDGVSGAPEPTTLISGNAGISDAGLWFDDYPDVRTKIVNKEFALRASYLDSNGEVAVYDGTYNESPVKSAHMSIIMNLVDDDCSYDESIHPELGRVEITDGESYKELGGLTIDYADDSKYVHIIAFDFGKLLSNAQGLNCNNSSLHSSLCMLPACFNTVSNIVAVFPPAFYPKVGTCIYGDGGGTPPCDSNAYEGSCGGVKSGANISPSEYNTDLGCAMCLADATIIEPCSDGFAVRPKAFTSTIDGTVDFRAGETQNHTFVALDELNGPSAAYDEAENTTFVVDVNISDATKSCPKKNINIDPSVVFGNGTVTNNYTLWDVGEFNLTIHEKLGAEFAKIDTNDTNASERLITPYGVQIKAVPHHFGFEANMTNAGNDFTYLSNFELFPGDRNMSASMKIKVKAQALNNAATSNYTDQCYAKDGNLTLNLTYPWQPLVPDANALSKLIYYNERNDTTNSILLTDLVATPNDVKIPVFDHLYTWDDNGTAFLSYKINFDRNRTRVVSPISLTFDSLEMLDNDAVTGGPFVPALRSANFYYGRAHAPRYRIDCSAAGAGPCTGGVRTYYEVYFHETGNGALLDLVAPSRLLSVDDIRWFQNAHHNVYATDDGNVDTFAPRQALYVGEVTHAEGVTSNIDTFTYQTPNVRGYPFKLSMEANASNWLIYHRFDTAADTNRFELEFNTIGGTSGVVDTDTQFLDANASVNTNRRIEW